MIQKGFRQDILYHNTVDIWINVCEENNIDWSNVQLYLDFINFLRNCNIKMNPMNLCIKETGGLYERGIKKAKFLEALSRVKGNRPVFVVKYDNNLKNKIDDFIASLRSNTK